MESQSLPDHGLRQGLLMAVQVWCCIYKRYNMSYQGLVNQGATCYLNSLLQTLFMTKQFRQHVFNYVHNPKKVPQKDSIPFQLQRLFVNLQTSTKPCYTRDLLKSFQWNDAEAFQQHDVQQFCRVLFDAIELSHKNSEWIKQLFGFVLNSYIDCGIHRSQNPQFYLDLSLPLRNPFTMEEHKSIGECIRQYLIPEQLQGVECSGCEDKKTVKKGLAFSSLPPILTLQLNRFQLNYENMQRQKVNSFLYFPQLLNMNQFLGPYHEIPAQSVPPQIQKHTVVTKKEVSVRCTDFEGLSKVPTKKRKNSDDIAPAKEHVSYFDEENANKRGAELKPLSKEDEKNKNLQLLADLKNTKFPIPGKKKVKEEGQKPMKEQTKQKPKASVDIEDDMLFGTLNEGFSFNEPHDVSNVDSKVGIVERPKFETTITKYEHDQPRFEWDKQYPQGTYALYAVLTHAGGSYGGHYYAYIFDGKDWFKFDDSSVRKATRQQVRQYGSTINSKQGTNAYLLFYRDVKTFQNQPACQIRADLMEKVKEQNEKSQKLAEVKRVERGQKEERLASIQRGLIIKVYQIGDKDPLKITIHDRTSETMASLRSLIKDNLRIAEADEDWRLRRYNQSDQTMYEVYGADLGVTTLQQLGWKESFYLAVETKKPQEQFEIYDPRLITVKLNVWQPGVIMIADKKLKPLRIRIRDGASFAQFFEKVKKESGLNSPLLLKRNYMGNHPVTVMKMEQEKDKTLLDLRFFNNITLYLEEGDKAVPRWVQEFEDQRYRCVIKFNNPKKGEERTEELYFDARRTLGELKKEISEILQMAQEDFRVKKSKQMPQLTAFRKRLNDLRFIGNEVLFIEEGRSAQGLIVVKQGRVDLIDDQIEYTIGEEIQFESSADLVTVDDLCRKIAQKTSIPEELIRIREYSASQFRQIFSRQDLLQRIHQKSLVWQQAQQQKGTQLLYRTFDIMTFEFSPLKQIFTDVSASYEEFTIQLAQQIGMEPDRVLIHKPLNKYLDKASMLDVQWNQIRFLQGSIRESPIAISCDGELLVVKAAQAPYKPPKNIKKTGQVEKHKGGQAKLKITVVAQNQDQPEEQAQPTKPTTP